jgi:hypothetical protein
MTSTTEGQAYALSNTTISRTVPIINLSNAPSSSFVPFIPLASQLNGLLPVTAGSHVPTTSQYLTVASTLVPAGLMGANGCIRTDSLATNNNSATVKAMATGFGGSVFYGSGNTTPTMLGISNLTRNRGVTNAQANSGLGNVSNPNNSFLTVDTTVDQYTYILLNSGATTDWIILQGGTVEILPAS